VGPLIDLIAPVYPKGEGAGRPPVGLERMLRIRCLQHWLTFPTRRPRKRCTTRG